MKKMYLCSLLTAVLALFCLQANADSTVTLSASNKNMTGTTSNITVTLGGSATTSSNQIKLVKSKTSTFTVTYGKTDKVITKIVFTWSKAPTSQ